MTGKEAVRQLSINACHSRDHAHPSSHDCEDVSLEVILHGHEATVVCHCCKSDIPCESEFEARKVVKEHGVVR